FDVSGGIITNVIVTSCQESVILRIFFRQSDPSAIFFLCHADFCCAHPHTAGRLCPDEPRGSIFRRASWRNGYHPSARWPRRKGNQCPQVCCAHSVVALSASSSLSALFSSFSSSFHRRS